MRGKREGVEIVNSAAQRIFLLVTLAAFLTALTRFTMLRFQTGELYPAYSTLRPDPIGAKALFKSLKRVEPGRVGQNFEPLARLKLNAGTTTIFLGVEGYDLGQEAESLRALAREGGRVVVALEARDGMVTPTRPRMVVPTPRGSTNTNTVVQVNLRDVLGLEVTRLKDAKERAANRVMENSNIPETIYWFGHSGFSSGTNGWETVYAVNGIPVVVQQKHGLGTLVVAADSFPFSNEALHEHPEPEFLLWVLGQGRVTFDETHLGVQRGTGIAVLMREFRLHGLAAGCLVLVGLWIWRNSAPLVPPQPPEMVVESVEGKTAREAVVHLLRRNLKDTEVLQQGLEEWAKSHPPRHYWETVRLEEARKLAKEFAQMPRPRSLADVQRKISELLFPKRN